MTEQKSGFVTSYDWLSIFFGLFAGIGVYLFTKIEAGHLHAFIFGLIYATIFGCVIDFLQKDRSHLEILRSTIVAPVAFALVGALAWCVLKLTA